MSRDDSTKTLLVISQVYVPDPASVGQHIHDAAAEMVRRGFRVVVYTSARGYDDPTQKYPSQELLDGVDVRRLPFSSFGKKSIKVRLLGQLLFLFQVMVRGLFIGKIDRILVSTSPPMASIAAIFISFFRRASTTFWAMDINPDQLIAMGQTTPGSVSARIFEAINRAILKRASAVVALDRFMGQTLEAKVPLANRMAIMPPWPHESHLEPVDHADNPFRKAQGLENKFVFMYSGNISPAHPVTTVLEAGKKLQDDDRLVFLFIGGGNGKKLIDAFIEKEKLTNVRTLPYQPLDMIKYSLSAADIHLVAMGTEMIGIVHPCKVYGAMTVARPILLLGPMECHVGELLKKHEMGWQIDHDKIDAAVEAIKTISTTKPSELARMGEEGRSAIRNDLSMKSLCGRFCDVIIRGTPEAPIAQQPVQSES